MMLSKKLSIIVVFSALFCLLSTAAAAEEYSAGRYHTVDQDHFDGSNENTWQQVYYVNDTFWKGPDSKAPIFLCVGGEGPALDGSAVADSVHCNIAVEWLEETGALMFAVEHRYYGCHNMSACPVDTWFGDNSLEFLSSRQALGDLVQFHGHITAEYNLTSANKWVTWGGSYPGMLAGWARIKFPQLFHASVASSAPVKAKVDMQGYNNVIASAFAVSDQNVGGSADCSEAIRAGHAEIGSLLNTSSGRSQLASQFSLPSAEWLTSASNQRAFCGEGVAVFDAQDNDPSCTAPACDIASICVIMLDTTIGDEVARLASLAATQQGAADSKPVWQNKLAAHDKKMQTKAALSDPDALPGTIPDFWGWQTCTEFGFYQTCESGTKCFFTQGLSTLDYAMSFCTSLFGISSDKVFENVKYTNLYYGADEPSGSRVLYPNGEVDPWHALSVLTAPANEDIPVMMVKGASHHFWTHPSKPSDQKAVVSARTAIKEQVTTWLKQD